MHEQAGMDVYLTLNWDKDSANLDLENKHAMTNAYINENVEFD